MMVRETQAHLQENTNNHLMKLKYSSQRIKSPDLLFKKSVYLVSLFVFLCTFQACPFYFEEPLGEFDNAEKIPKNLPGTWTHFGQDEKIYEISVKTNGKKLIEMYLTVFQKNGQCISREKFTGFFYNHHGHMFLNIKNNENAIAVGKIEFENKDQLAAQYIQLPKDTSQLPYKDPAELLNSFPLDSILSGKFIFLRKGSLLYQLKFSKKGF